MNTLCIKHSEWETSTNVSLHPWIPYMVKLPELLQHTCTSCAWQVSQDEPCLLLCSKELPSCGKVLVGTIPAEKERCILVKSPLKPTNPKFLKYIPSKPAKSYNKIYLKTVGFSLHTVYSTSCLLACLQATVLGLQYIQRWTQKKTDWLQGALPNCSWFFPARWV